MGMKKWLRNFQRQGNGGVNGQVSSEDAPQINGEVHQLDVSEGTLEMLVQGQQTLLQRRQQLMAQLQEVDAAIQQQEGGIRMMRNLLAGQQKATTEAVPQPS